MMIKFSFAVATSLVLATSAAAWAADTANAESTQLFVQATRLASSGKPDEARKVLESIPAGTHPEATLKLAQYYAYGFGGDKDSAKALELLQAEHARGNSAALLELANVYLDIDRVKAREWLNLAVAANDPFAKLTLAQMLLDGDGGAKDPARAFKLFSEAAPLFPAPFLLADMLFAGNGVAKDLVEAYAWLQVGLANKEIGRDNPISIKARELLAQLDKKLSKKQLQDALARAASLARQP